LRTVEPPVQCSWTTSLELSADEHQTAGLVIQPCRKSGPKRSVNLRLITF